MIRVLGPIAIIALSLYAFFDCARTDQDQVRGLPKWAWLLVIIFVSFTLGAIAWLIWGRPKSPGKGRGYGQKPRIIPPDDDPDFLRKL